MTFEEAVDAYKEIIRQIQELEERKKELSGLILSQMKEKTIHLQNYVVRRYERLSYKTTIEEARELEATKMEETLDKDKLKALYNIGHPVPGITRISYLGVSKLPMPQTQTPWESS